MISDAEERTALSWRRTTLTATIVGLLALRPAVVNLPAGDAALFASMMALTWFAFVANARRRIRRISSGEFPTSPIPLATALILGYVTLGMILVVRFA